MLIAPADIIPLVKLPVPPKMTPPVKVEVAPEVLVMEPPEIAKPLDEESPAVETPAIKVEEAVVEVAMMVVKFGLEFSVRTILWSVPEETMEVVAFKPPFPEKV